MFRSGYIQALCMALLCLAAVPAVTGQESGGGRADHPSGYVLEYPVAKRCCPPIRSTFFEARRTVGVVRGKRFRHKPNGGYGLPVVDKADGKNLLHLGADLGWHQVGEPVFAMANGVVRLSTGPDPDDEGKKRLRPSDLSWGNLVVIEHRFDEDEFFTTIYGHLATDRLVKTGDIVQAGQQIGEIGRHHARINGGYTPHLHFGVREGRLAEIGCSIIRLSIDGHPAPVILRALGEEMIELELPPGISPPFRMTLNGRRYEVVHHNGKTIAPAGMLWEVQRPDFALVGYATSTDGWRDPIRFLREHQADTNPAPYRLKAARSPR